MARLLFERAPAGFRTVRGAPIETLQRALTRAGLDTRGTDGIFGNDTETALRAWQQARGRPVTGKVDADTWTALTDSDVPSLFLRALGVTAVFEGHGYTLVVGNFDGAGITWGIIGFTLLNGELVDVLREIRRDGPAAFSTAFGALEDDIVRVMDGSREARRQFAESISIPPEKRKVRPEWKAAFERLGNAPEARAVQLRFAENRWRRALTEVGKLGLKTELGAGLCYDVIVQNGSFKPAVRTKIRARMAANPAMTERELRVVMADAVAEASNPRFIEDVRSRKRTCATGEGTVHGAKYRLRGWGVDEVAP
jgi:hypothetical protein